MYTPEDGDPSVPAVVSTLDVCPGECVGYASFKQEKTRYDVAKFPLHFIPGKATSCSNAYVGCDGFTNLDTVAEGGEGKEYYTYLRACLTPEMADGSQNKKSATFFTWEGSDNAGYQLKTWNLLESNTAKATLTFPLAAGGNHVESAAGLAPCTNWKLTDV